MTLDLRKKASLLRQGNPESAVAICCLWLPIEKLYSTLNPEHFAVIGNLYSAKHGLNYIVANLLANPQIRYLVVYGLNRPGINRSRSGEALHTLLSIGVEHKQSALGDGTPVWKVLGHDAFLYAEYFSALLLNQLRHHITVVDVDDKDDLSNLLQRLSVLPALTPSLTAPVLIDFPEETNSEYYPAQGSTHVVRGRSVAELYPKILYTVMRHGHLNKSHYEEDHMECLNLVSVLEGEIASPANGFITRDMPWFPGLYTPNSVERVPDFVRASSSDLASDDALIDYTEKVLFGDRDDDMDDEPQVAREGVQYTYGDRMRWWFERDQVKDVIDKLSRDPDAKSGVVSLWDPEVDHTKRGSPCLNHLWFRVRDARLWMTALIRSNDMYGAWPANAYSLRVLQEYVLASVNAARFYTKADQLRIGDLTIISESAHIYAHSFSEAELIIAEHYERVVDVAHQRFDDPKGSFVITVEDATDEKRGASLPIIVCRQQSPGDGWPVAHFVGRTAKEVYEQLARANALTDLYHALDIGAELQKAEFAVRSPTLAYVQDQPLEWQYRLR